ncbi:hypothetical protein STEG23_014925 [Scotinomys teguina]
MANGHRLLLENAQQVVLMCTQGERFLTGPALRSLAVLEGASLVVGTDGFIKAIGPADAIQRQFSGETFEERIDCSGKCVLPGLVDAHTHPVWAGQRVHEFAMKLAGATYMDIHQAGGGINFTVEHTRQASEEELFRAFQRRLHCMMRAGTTLVECKSGYGLNLDTELKMLRVIERARRELHLGLSATYCGGSFSPQVISGWGTAVTQALGTEPEGGDALALQLLPVHQGEKLHWGGVLFLKVVVLRGKTALEAADDIISHHLPRLKELRENGELHVDNIDVFCEKGVFDLDTTRRILEGGKKMGLQINFHGDELHPMKAAELGAELGAQAISHLEEVSDEGIAAMAAARCSAILLPTTAYMLRLKQPRARKMLDEGVIVALGSDFNPNAYCFSMVMTFQPMVMHLACVNMRMTMQEALAAATINAAYALGKSHTHGSLEVGKQGDAIIINASSDGKIL